MVRIYGTPASRAFRVIWAARELGIPFENVPTDFRDGGTFSSELRAVNPNGRIPALEDGDFRLFESLAINLYLADKAKHPISPAGPIERALAVQWSIWAVAELEKTLLNAYANLAIFPEAERDHEEAEICIQKLARPFNVLNAAVAKTGWLIGDRFTIADLNVASITVLGKFAGLSFEATPALDRWLSNCLARPDAHDHEVMLLSGPRPPFWRMIVA